MDAVLKKTTEIIDRFRRKEITAAIFFDIKKVHDKVNREHTFEQLESMGIQGRLIEIIRELIGERSISQSK